MGFKKENGKTIFVTEAIHRDAGYIARVKSVVDGKIQRMYLPPSNNDIIIKASGIYEKKVNDQSKLVIIDLRNESVIEIDYALTCNIFFYAQVINEQYHDNKKQNNSF
jgi:hypothetical protein